MQRKRPLASLLVTGGAGFIGSAFIRYLLQNEHFSGKIINLDALTYAGNLENLNGFHDHPRYHFVHGDIRNHTLLETLFSHHQIDTVIHFAAETHVDRSISLASLFVETNILGTLSLLETVRKFPSVHFHHVSTDEVYGSLGESGFFHEHSCYRPNSPYSASKASSDHLVRAFHQTYALSTTLSHCSNNFGPHQNPEKLIPLMILNCLREKPLPIYGRGANVRDWLYVDDHAEALWSILQFGKRGETYDIGGDAEFSNLELIYLLIDILSDELKNPSTLYSSLIQFVADRPGHDFRYAIDCSKIKKELNWHPKTSIKAGLLKTIRWYTAHDSKIGFSAELKDALNELKKRG
jgi:dTDP-glucose 4,6-dehydratase